MHAGLRPEQNVVRLTIEADDDRVRAEVSRSRLRWMSVRSLRYDGVARVGGFGLRIVEAVADGGCGSLAAPGLSGSNSVVGAPPLTIGSLASNPRVRQRTYAGAGSRLLFAHVSS